MHELRVLKRLLTTRTAKVYVLGLLNDLETEVYDMEGTTPHVSWEEIIRGRRSVRRFQNRDLPENVIREVVDYARYAPSDTNSQTWEFIAVVNRDKIQAIAELTWGKLREIASEAQQQGLHKEARLLLKSFGPYATAFTNAPVLLIVLSTPYESKFRSKIFDPLQLVTKEIWDLEGIKSSCLAAENLMLAAYALGLATCPMTGPVLLAENSLKEFLHIREGRQVNMVIALGYPDEKPSMPKRKEVAEIFRIID